MKRHRHGLCAIAASQLGEDIAGVDAHCPFADSQADCNFFIRLSVGDQLENLQLAWTELRAGNPVHQTRCHLLWKRALAGMNGADRIHQFPPFHVLQEMLYHYQAFHGSEQELTARGPPGHGLVAERDVSPGGPAADVEAPQPLRKVDPKYIASAADERVAGKVRLWAVIARKSVVRG